MKIRFCLLDADYIENGGRPLVRLWGKTNDGKSVCCFAEQKPYFYVLPKTSTENTKTDIEKIKQKDFKIIRTEKIKRNLAGDENDFLKIFVDLPQNVPKARDAVKGLDSVAEQYEYAINFYRRFLIDSGFSGMQWLEVEGEKIDKDYACDIIIRAKKIIPSDSAIIPGLKLLAFDIETVEQAGKQKIIMISLFGKNFKKVISYQKSKYEKHVEVVKNEKELLERFIEIIREQDPDIITGYNCFPYEQEVILENGTYIPLGKYVESYKYSKYKPRVFGLIGNELKPVDVRNVWEYNSGSHIILKIKTRTGKEIKTTLENKLLSGTSEGINWIEVIKLKKGDLIAVPIKIDIKPQVPNVIDLLRDDRYVTDLQFIKKIKSEIVEKFGYRNVANKLGLNYNTLRSSKCFSISNIKKMVRLLGLNWNSIKLEIKEVDRTKLPKLDEDLMYIAGLIASDGTIRKDKKKFNVNQICFGNTDNVLVNSFCNIFEDKFGCVVKKSVIKLYKHGQKDRTHATVSSSIFKDFLNHIGISSGNKDKIGIKCSKIFSFPESFIAAFIGGMIDGDGYVHGINKKYRTFYISCKNRTTKKELQKLLMRMGILVSLHKKGHYILKCGHNKKLIKKMILPYLKKRYKINRFLDSEKSDYRSGLDVVPHAFGTILNKIRKKQNISSYEFENTPHSTIYYYENNLLKTISKNKATEILKELENKIGRKISEMRKLINSNIFWDSIKEIKIEKSPAVYDLTTSSGNFIVNNIVAHNSDNFDFSIIQERAEENKVKVVLSRDRSHMKFARRARISSAHLVGRTHIDIFNFINNILSPQLQTEVLTLDAVSAELLGDRKIELEYEELLEMWRKKKDMSKLAEYCLKDSELTFRLGNFILPQIYELSRLVGQLPFDISRMTYSQLVEWYLSKKAFSMQQIIPNQPKWDEIQERRLRERYIGGFVKEPIGGIHESIAVLDFRSMYPSIIATFNISPEMLRCSCCKDTQKVPGLEHWFCKKRKGFVSSVIREVIERRKKLKERLKTVKKTSEEWERLNNEQFSIKTIANASYGYFAFAGSKWYCYECAQSAAAFGRFYIGMIIEELEKEGFTVIYGDTDSVFVKVQKGNLEQSVDAFLEKINRKLPGILELDLQGLYKRAIFIPRGAAPGTAKKRYALIDEKGNLTIRGLETVRRDWCKLAKDVQRTVLEIILKEKDVEKSVSYVRSILNKLKQQKILLRDLVIYEQLTKPLVEYRQIGPHVVAARKIKERGRPIGEGMIIMFAITKGKDSISERAEPIEDVSLNDIDTNYYINNQIVPAALRVLQVLGIDEKKLLGKKTELKRFIK